MKTLAAVLESIKSPLNIIELDIPALGKGQVLVKMSYSGICRSQINEILGFKGEDKYLPHTLGHEGSGEVIDIGPEVCKVKKGDHVVVSWIKGKGLNADPISYRDSSGRKINSGPVSTFLTKAIISENRLVVIDQNFPLREAALLGCAFPTGAGVIFNQMKIRPQNSLAIIGVGGIGASAILAAKMMEAHPIIAIDICDRKLEKASFLGASDILNSKKTNIIEEVKKITQGKGVDFSLECAGVVDAMENAFSIINENSGMCVIAGNVPFGKTIKIDPFGLIKGKKIVGSWGGGSDIDDDIARYVELFRNKKIRLSSLITNEIFLKDINNLIFNFESSVIGRSLVCLEKN